MELDNYYEHDTGHMIKMAAMPIYGKTPSNSSPPEPVDRFPRNSVCSMRDPSPSSFVHIMTLGQILQLTFYFYMGKCDNDGFFGFFFLHPLTWNLAYIVN